eukprot:s591_g6.t1
MNDSQAMIRSMACHYPGDARHQESYWLVALGGADGLVKVPVTRWDATEYFSADEKEGFTYAIHGGFCADEDVIMFDNAFFGLSDEEARVMSPAQRLVMQTGYEALQNAGVTKASAMGLRCGVYLGDSGCDWTQLFGHLAGPSRALGSAQGIGGSRLAHALGLRGPTLTVDTACSSSLVAIGVAHTALRKVSAEQVDPGVNPHVKMALAQGCNLLLSPRMIAERITAAMENYTLPKLMANLLRGCNAETVEKKARAAEVNAAELAVEAEVRWPEARQALEAMMAKSPDPPSLQSLGAEKPMTQAQLRKSLLEGGHGAGGGGAMGALGGGFGGGLGAAGAGREAMASTRATLPPLGAVMAGAPANAQRGAMQAPAVEVEPSRLPLPGALGTPPRKIHPTLLSGPHMLSPRGRCFTFDGTADGYARGEGCGSLTLKMSPDSEEAQLCLAMLIGTAVNQDGRSASMTAPNGPSQQQCIRWRWLPLPRLLRPSWVILGLQGHLPACGGDMSCAADHTLEHAFSLRTGADAGHGAVLEGAHSARGWWNAASGLVSFDYEALKGSAGGKCSAKSQTPQVKMLECTPPRLRRHAAAVQAQKELVNVQQIQATSSAFAAMSADGTIVTWGDPENGGLR